MPRSLWSGSISFGLVNVPVRLYSAVKEHKLQFHFVHEKDNSPIGYEKICKKENKPVPDDEIVKAFEFDKGEYVFMEEEDFQASKVEGYKAIDIVDFVPYEDIDPIYFAKTYYLGPGEGAEKVYSLLVRALEDTDLVAIAKFVMRERQDDDRRDHAEDDGVLGHRLSFVSAPAGANAVNPARGRHDSGIGLPGARRHASTW